MQEIVAYLGPGGSFCEEAAWQYRRENDWPLLPLRSIREVFRAVAAGNVNRGIVPIENSYEGAVNQTLDLLTGNDNLKIVDEIIIPVRQNLLIHPNSTGRKIDCILSHAQALAQCQEYLYWNYPNVPVREVHSTAEAACMVAISDETWAAIATLTAAETYNLKVLAADIHDQTNNSTRFVVLSREEVVCESGGKTSLLLYVVDRPGALYEVLREFYIRGINLCKIESRPARTRIGEYLFFIDIEGNRQEEHISETLAALMKVAAEVRVLGSYPFNQAALGRYTVLPGN